MRGTSDTDDSGGQSKVSSRNGTDPDHLGYVKIGDLDDLQVRARGSNAVWIADGGSGTEAAIYDPNQPSLPIRTRPRARVSNSRRRAGTTTSTPSNNTDDVTACLAEQEQNTRIKEGTNANQWVIPLQDGVTNVLEVGPNSPIFDPGSTVVFSGA